ncbi:hypothetical protein D3C75_727780 [compost metagenome]
MGFLIPLPHKIGHTVVQLHLLRGKLQRHIAHLALGIGHTAVAAPVADHDLGQLILETTLVFGCAFAQDEGGLELALSPQLSGLQHVDEIVQLLQIVLHRRSGKQQAIFFAKLADKLVVGGFFVLQLMGFVNDQHVIVHVQDNLPVGVPFGRIHGCHDDVALLPHVFLLLGGGGDAEFGVQLPHPLQHKGGGNQDQRFFDQSPDDILLQNQPRFYGFPQAYLIGQNRSAPHFQKHPACGFQLVGHGLHLIQVLQAQQLVEAAYQPGRFRLVGQLE